MIIPRLSERLFAVLALLSLASPLLAANVSGVVRESGATTLEGMVVAAYTASGTLQATGKTDFLGRYGLDLPAGDYKILAYDLNGNFATAFDGGADSFETSPVTKLSASDSKLIDFSLVRAGMITGHVTTSGTPLRDSAIAIYNPSGTQRGFTTTDLNGRFSLVVPAGEYKLVAFHNSGVYTTQFYSGRQTYDTADRVVVVARATVANVNFDLQPAASLIGKVVDAAGRPLSDMRVIAFTPDGTTEVASAKSDVNGNFTLRVPAGSYRLLVVDEQRGIYANAFMDNVTSFERTPILTLRVGDFRTDIVFRMEVGARVSGVVVEESTATPLPGITVAAFNLDGTKRFEEKTDEKGAYSFALAPGRYKMVAFDNNRVYAAQFHEHEITFTASTIVAAAQGGGFTANFSLVSGAHVRGRVFEEGTTRQASGVSIAAYTADGIEVGRTVADAAGNYDLVLPPGTYKLLAFDPELRFATAYLAGARTFETAPLRSVQAGQIETIDFGVIRGVRVSGTVTDDGALLSGIEIVATNEEGLRVATAIANDGRYNLVVTPGTYAFVASDPQRRFGTTYYSNAQSVRTATPVTISGNATVALDFELDLLPRRRGVNR